MQYIKMDHKLVTPEEGSPQGSVVSPLLSNLYLHQFDEEWYKRGNHRRLKAISTRYADNILLQAPQEDWRIWEEAKGILIGI